MESSKEKSSDSGKASVRDDKELIDCMASAGGKINIALLQACFRDQQEVVKSLIKAGADVNTKDEKGQNALVYACCYKEIVEFLIKAGADVNNVDKCGQTVLFNACINGNLELVDLLIKSGAHVDIVDNTHQTPRILARTYGHRAIVELLNATLAPAAAATSDPTSSTAVISAAKKIDRDIAELKKRIETLENERKQCCVVCGNLTTQKPLCFGKRLCSACYREEKYNAPGDGYCLAYEKHATRHRNDPWYENSL